MSWASDHDGTWRTALEPQLSPITVADITARSERMRADGVTSVWFSDRHRVPWLGTVPSARLAWPDNGQCLFIAEGLVRFKARWSTVPTTLAEFLGRVFTRGIVPHRPMSLADATCPGLGRSKLHSAEYKHLAEEEARAAARMSPDEHGRDEMQMRLPGSAACVR